MSTIDEAFLEALTDKLDDAVAPPMSLDDAIEVMEYVQEHVRGALAAMYEDRSRS